MTVAELVDKALTVSALAHEEREVDSDDLLQLQSLAYDLAENVLALLRVDKPCGWAGAEDVILDDEETGLAQLQSIYLNSEADEVRWAGTVILDAAERLR